MNFGELPLEDIVSIINNMDYRSIINLSQTSSEFNSLVNTNDIVADIVYDKLNENLAGRLEYLPDENVANIDIYLGDELNNQKYEINWTLDLSLEDLQGIITELDSESQPDGDIPFGDGKLYYDNTLQSHLAYDVGSANVIFSVNFNKILFVRLLKEYEELLRTGTPARVYIRNDRSVDKIIS